VNEDSHLRELIREITARVAAGFISAETAADQILKLIHDHAAPR
jgi:hypothetical protein